MIVAATSYNCCIFFVIIMNLGCKVLMYLLNFMVMSHIYQAITWYNSLLPLYYHLVAEQ